MKVERARWEVGEWGPTTVVIQVLARGPSHRLEGKQFSITL